MLVVDGVTLVCPWRTRLRAWVALQDFRSGLPDSSRTRSCRGRWRRRRRRSSRRTAAEYPEPVAHIVSQTWEVPLRWFLLVDPSDRRLSLEPGASSLTYRTAMSQARRRVARALAVLRRELGDGPVVEATEVLGRWLESFHPRSVVELDYGGLVQLLDDDQLRADETARDVHSAVIALDRGDRRRQRVATSARRCGCGSSRCARAPTDVRD